MNEVFQFYEYANGQPSYSLPVGAVITFKDGRTMTANDAGKKWTPGDLEKIASVQAPDGTVQNLAENAPQGQGTNYVRSSDGKYYSVSDGEYTLVGDAKTISKLNDGDLQSTTVFYTGDQLLGKEDAPTGDVSGSLASQQGALAAGTGSDGTYSGGGIGSNPSLQNMLDQAGLSDDQKSAIDLVYEAIANNDRSLMERAKAAMAAATEFSDPFFKAQARLAIDALDRSLTGREDDLSYREQQLSNTLNDLRNDIQSAGDYLSFQQQQELKSLERNYEQQLQATQEDLAARGFTSSSVRSKKEQLLSDTYGDLRQSSNRSFTERQNQLTNTLGRGERDTQAEIERLRQLTEQGKIDDLRKTEEYLGTDALKGIGYNDNLLGNLPGELDRQKVQDAMSFASGSGLIF